MSSNSRSTGRGAHIGRRTFLGLSGAAAGAALLQGCAKQETKMIEQALKRSSTNPGEASWRRSLCRQCGAGCELSVRTIDGRAKKIEGDASSPATYGGVCALGHSALQELYHPSRILEPQRRDGQVTSWEEALAELGALVEETSATDGAIAICCDADPVQRTLVERIAANLGATVTLVESQAAAVERRARNQFFGTDVELFPSLEGADLVVASGASILDRWGNPVAQAHAIAELQAAGGALIVIGERMSLTAAKADLWLPTQGSLEPLYRALSRLPTAPSSADLGLESLADRLGLSVERLEQLAQALSSAKRPRFVVGGEGASVADVVAGLELQRAFKALPLAVDARSLLTPDAVAVPTRNLAELRDAVTDGSVRAVISVGVDLVGAVPERWGLEQAFSDGSGAHLVSLAVTPDATTQIADWTLPIQTGLEQLQVTLSRTVEVASGPALAIADPVISARGAARNAIDVLLAIEEAAGGSKSEWQDATSARDAVVAAAAALDGKTTRSVVSAAKRASGRIAIRPEALTNAIVAAPVVAGKSPESPSEVDVASASNSAIRIGLFEGVRGERYGLGRSWLDELPDPMSSVMWGSWIELAPADAAALGISAGDTVEVKSPDGHLETTAFLQPAMRPGSAAMPVGGFDPSALAGGDPRNLLANEADHGVPLQSFVAMVRKTDAAPRHASPIFGRGLKSSEQIPAGWKSQHLKSGASLITLGAAAHVFAERDKSESESSDGGKQ